MMMNKIHQVQQYFEYLEKITEFNYLIFYHISELLKPMEKSARRISEELEVLSVHQQYMRNRELRHIWSTFKQNLFFCYLPFTPFFLAQRSTNIRIFWLSILESIALLSISFAQVYYIKRFFKNNNRRMI